MRIKKTGFACLLMVSIIIGASANVNAEVYKYYDKLNSKQKKAYKVMEKKIEKAESAPLSVNVKCNYRDVIRAIEAVSADRADLFSGNIVVDFDYTKNTTRPVFSEINGKKISKKLRSIVNNTKLEGESDLETAINIHDFIINNTEYDFSSDDSFTDKFSMKGALLNNQAVCEGYARTFKYICDRYNLPCMLVTGYSQNPGNNAKRERHMWNYLKIDGTWYAVDTTWDDNLTEGDNICYDYFLVGSDTPDSANIPFSESHLRNPDFFNFDIDKVKGFSYPSLSRESFFGNDSNIYEYINANYN